MSFCQEMNSHFWHFHVFYYILNLKLQLLRALVLILQYRLHFYLKRGTNNNRLLHECDFERLGFYAHMLYGFVFDGWNSTFLKSYYILCILPLVSHIHILAVAEVRSWRQYPVKTGLNSPECSRYIISETFLFMVLCLQSGEYMDLKTRGWKHLSSLAIISYVSWTLKGLRFQMSMGPCSHTRTQQGSSWIINHACHLGTLSIYGQGPADEINDHFGRDNLLWSLVGGKAGVTMGTERHMCATHMTH